MKKMLRIAAALAALLAMTNFIGCKNDDDEESGNGLENTYWAMEDFSLDVVENVSLTFKNVGYVHIEDSSKGSVYAADVESLDYSTMDLTKTNSVDISYSSEKQSFTYVVEGSKITVTSKYTDDDGKEKTEIIEGTLAADKKSFTTKYTDDDGKEVSETYTRIDKAPAKATLVITVTGGSTGGTTGGETGTTTGFENTYWVCEEVSYENSGVKITLKNAQYIHIGDSTSGSIYIANVEDYLKGEVVAGTHSVSYPDKGVEFTYTVEGSNVTIKMGEETINAVIAADKNSFTITDGSETHEYTKADAAPTEATVKVEITAAPSTKLNVSMDVATLVFADITEGLTDTADPAKNGLYMIPASTTILGALTPAKDGKAYWYTSKDRKKISALQLNGDGALNFTLSGAATVKVTFLSTGDTNISAITVNGTENSVTGKTATEFTWEISDAGDYSILSSGTSNARITKLSILEK